jgi:hypothetical protein
MRRRSMAAARRFLASSALLNRLSRTCCNCTRIGNDLENSVGQFHLQRDMLPFQLGVDEGEHIANQIVDLDGVLLAATPPNIALLLESTSPARRPSSAIRFNTLRTSSRSGSARASQRSPAWLLATIADNG